VEVDSDPVRPDPEQVDILRIRETQKTLRYLILTFGIVTSLGLIAWAAVRMTEKPPWLVLALAILAASSGPTALLLYTVRYVRRWTRDHMGRTAELERIIDPARTTSSLNPDGTDPPESLP
jgi:hypothetical protein